MARLIRTIQTGEEPEEDYEYRVKEDEEGLPPFSWESKVHYLADFYNETWDAVSSWNIMKFVHRIEYANYHNKKQRLK